jgi:hypothetical protein
MPNLILITADIEYLDGALAGLVIPSGFSIKTPDASVARSTLKFLHRVRREKDFVRAVGTGNRYTIVGEIKSSTIVAASQPTPCQQQQGWRRGRHDHDPRGLRKGRRAQPRTPPSAAQAREGGAIMTGPLSNLRGDSVSRYAPRCSISGEDGAFRYHVWINTETLEIEKGTSNSFPTLYKNSLLGYTRLRTRHLDATAKSNAAIVRQLLDAAPVLILEAKAAADAEEAARVKVAEEAARAERIRNAGPALLEALRELKDAADWMRDNFGDTNPYRKNSEEWKNWESAQLEQLDLVDAAQEKAAAAIAEATL